jgi:acyl CoA:acetate/3-ketoacid CoA transferase alpha subunit
VKNKVFAGFDNDAVREVRAGNSLRIFCRAIAGTPQNLIPALRAKNVENLTLKTHNFIPGWVGASVCPEEA